MGGDENFQKTDINSSKCSLSVIGSLREIVVIDSWDRDDKLGILRRQAALMAAISPTRLPRTSPTLPKIPETAVPAVKRAPFAVVMGDVEVARAIRLHCRSGWLPTRKVWSAIGRGDTAAVRAWLEHGVQVNQTFAIGSTNGVTLLMGAAAQQGCSRMVSLLLLLGAEANMQDSQGRTALMIAASKGEEPAVEALLQAGASMTLKDSLARTALHYAQAIGHVDCVQTLLRHLGVQAGLNDWLPDPEATRRWPKQQSPPPERRVRWWAAVGAAVRLVGARFRHESVGWTL